MRYLIFLSGILASVLLFLIPNNSYSQCSAYTPVVTKRTVVTTPYVTPSYATEVAVIPLIAQIVPVFVPTYGAGYVAPAPIPTSSPVVNNQPAGSSNPNQEILDLLRKIDDRSSRLEDRVNRLERAMNVQPPPNPSGPNIPMPKADNPTSQQGNNNGVEEQVIVARCASCHDASVSATKGGTITLLHNNIVDKWDSDLSLRVLRAVNDGTMPKNGRLSEEDGLKIVTFSLKKRG
jgi:hypothetical protein